MSTPSTSRGASSLRAACRAAGACGSRSSIRCCRWPLRPCLEPMCSLPRSSASRSPGPTARRPLRLKANGWYGNAAVGICYETLPWLTAAAAALGAAPSMAGFHRGACLWHRRAWHHDAQRFQGNGRRPAHGHPLAAGDAGRGQGGAAGLPRYGSCRKPASSRCSSFRVTPSMQRWSAFCSPHSLPAWSGSCAIPWRGRSGTAPSASGFMSAA